MNNPKVIVVSAVNLTEGGTLTVLKGALRMLSETYGHNSNYKIIALVHDKRLCDYLNVEYICFPNVKKSWINRVYFEYFFLKKLSKKLKVYLWFSLHDITPNVIAEKRVVYCHNATPFYKIQLRDFYFSKKITLFSLFYKYLYRINIKRNSFVVVQQNWIRNEFASMFGLSKKKIIVATPNRTLTTIPPVTEKDTNNQTPFQFFYPSLPRTFKNFELLCEATKILSKMTHIIFETVITISGNENSYSRWFFEKYKDVPQIKFVGLLSHEQVSDYYHSIDCLVFPSKLETWGLPISEFIPYDKPMLVADLEYAHETTAGVQKVGFFNPNSAQDLADKMLLLINGEQSFLKYCHKLRIEEPCVSSWEELFELLLQNK